MPATVDGTRPSACCATSPASSISTFYNWKAKYGGMDLSNANACDHCRDAPIQLIEPRSHPIFRNAVLARQIGPYSSRLMLAHYRDNLLTG